MDHIFRNIAAIIVGFIAGSALNMGLVQLGHQIFPISGVDLNDMDSLAAIMPALSYHYFIFPFLAHALGTLLGASTAAWIAKSHKMKFALSIGFLFLIGGITVNLMLPGPTWFSIIDIVIAYIPMAYIGGLIGIKKIIKK